MRYKSANLFFIFGVIFYIVAAVLAFKDSDFDLVFVSIGIVFLGIGLYIAVKQKITKKPLKNRRKD